jgi:hypothetical protein
MARLSQIADDLAYMHAHLAIKRLTWLLKRIVKHVYRSVVADVEVNRVDCQNGDAVVDGAGGVERYNRAYVAI